MILTFRWFNHNRGTGSVIRINLRPFARLRARWAAERFDASFDGHLVDKFHEYLATLSPQEAAVRLREHNLNRAPFGLTPR